MNYSVPLVKTSAKNMTKITQTYVTGEAPKLQHYVKIEKGDNIIHLAITEQQFKAINKLIQK